MSTRTSARLAKKRKLGEPDGEATPSSLASSNKNDNRTEQAQHHRPKAGQSAFKNDCGPLPSEWYRISASIIESVPWGFVCGYPTRNGTCECVCAPIVDTKSKIEWDVSPTKSCYTYHPYASFSNKFLDCTSTTGDLYGGAHYLQSSSADMTPQGRAIQDASIRFGNGRTLPFTPCKKGFVPYAHGERKYACPLHHKARRKRVLGEGGRFRPGELDLHILWQKYEPNKTELENNQNDGKK